MKNYPYWRGKYPNNKDSYSDLTYRVSNVHTPKGKYNSTSISLKAEVSAKINISISTKAHKFQSWVSSPYSHKFLLDSVPTKSFVYLGNTALEIKEKRWTGV